MTFFAELDNKLMRDFISLLLGFILGYVYLIISPRTTVIDSNIFGHGKNNDENSNDTIDENIELDILEENKIFKKKEKCYRYINKSKC